ncbi:methylenetetrahydrofolate--tRNA-(uracil(54)-C(5))-methyltransferase (FADH(2)-oxidizing) TrmFO [Sulfobacillus harzensis]|uniref:Methylenetetrahydrofolate--tRNA-(uracil-5-)-methyltransferase TrmFO n=1 Tax=Sulfobacillus harzensis TaxID=2729629 RepID=A0A7Y0Q4I6_9FIRM|nr:methylenetetrahydrofolate--tRNA-(uracil(54)-C(5))-methyltransferase (FADH(2)-oxidizing) TrmFO [Sulfobacillus harzensis]NMP24061.1 methylenetetrahydrofolate--tRNA-(uracil(54)-C(5))-methyltransferase (FADH(2)-oxidizing) TrmFO [Sulfobacillus harzensis]
MKKKLSSRVTVVGGGLAGSEAAYQLAQRGIAVDLYEMRPVTMTPAHHTERFAELVCSNSFGGDQGLSPAALLKAEMRLFDSLILKAGGEARVDAGSALAVDREIFSAKVTEAIESHPHITIHREVVETVPEGPTIIATGPLTHASLSQSLIDTLGDNPLSFFDAAAPIVFGDSIDMDYAFYGSREGSDDYINCPLTKDEYEAFYQALVTAEQHQRHDFEDASFFEGCLPIEELARRGKRTPLFGPMKPTGLSNPLEGGRRPYAVVQLRRDNAAGSLWSLVGFQTNLRWGEQKRVLQMIPALHRAEFARYGVMHRNTYLKSPKILEASLNTRIRPDLWLAGQMIGVEGYVESAASGILCAVNAARHVNGEEPLVLPRETMMGALFYYVSHADPESFQPMNATFGLFELPDEVRAIKDKRERRQWMKDRALSVMGTALALDTARYA